MSDTPTGERLTQNIILDTCILQYFSDRYISVGLKTYLINLIGKGFGLAISDISVLELLQGANASQETEGLNVLKLFNRYNLQERILVAAAQLSTLYSQDKIYNDGISMADRIIASTVILTGSLVLTADINDYPRPFFDEAEEKLITYRKKNKSNMIAVQLLRPDVIYINQRFSERPKG